MVKYLVLLFKNLHTSTVLCSQDNGERLHHGDQILPVPLQPLLLCKSLNHHPLPTESSPPCCTLCCHGDDYKSICKILTSVI